MGHSRPDAVDLAYRAQRNVLWGRNVDQQAQCMAGRIGQRRCAHSKKHCVQPRSPPRSQRVTTFDCPDGKESACRCCNAYAEFSGRQEIGDKWYKATQSERCKRVYSSLRRRSLRKIVVFSGKILRADCLRMRAIVPSKFRVGIPPCRGCEPVGKEIGKPKNWRHHRRQIGANDSGYDYKSRYRAVRRAIHPITEIAAAATPFKDCADYGSLATLALVLHANSSMCVAPSEVSTLAIIRCRLQYSLNSRFGQIINIDFGQITVLGSALKSFRNGRRRQPT